jgi:hypothetical protein
MNLHRISIIINTGPVITCLICLISVFLDSRVVYAQLVQSQQVKIGEIPEGLSASDWGSIKRQMRGDKYHAYTNDEGDYSSANPAHGWNLRYQVDGTTRLISSNKHVNNYQIGIRLTAIGYATLQQLDKPQQLSAIQTTVTYQWTDNLKEWWVNRPDQLEQWFSLAQAPIGRPAAHIDQTQPLTLQLQLVTTLNLSQQGDSLQFTRNNGNAITYNKLKVWDSTGRSLPAHMQLSGQQLSLMIDDRKAQYPLTIDPSFQQESYLKASNTDTFDSFGGAVAISGDTVVVGARYEGSNATGVNGDQSNNDASLAGAVYVFVRSDNSWSQQAYLKASNSDSGDHFGYSVAISGETIVVGAREEDSNTTGVNGDQNNELAMFSGAAYVFERSGNSWSQQAYLKASNSDFGDSFGIAVAISGDTVVVGARSESSNATEVNGDQSNNSSFEAGAAYVFVRSGSNWSQQAYLKASNADSVRRGDFFGAAVAISGDTVVVGALGEDSTATGVNGDQNNDLMDFSGAAYVFVRSGNSWSQQAYLKASNTDFFDTFGRTVAISGDTVVVGALGEDSNATGVNGDQGNNDLLESGAAYVFMRSGSSWSQQAYLKRPKNESTGGEFGNSVAISGDIVVVGTRFDSLNSPDSSVFIGNSGAAYVFMRIGNIWSQQAYLLASNMGTRDEFGTAVAISGDTVVVGADREDSNATTVDGDQSNNVADSAGAAYVFHVTDGVTDTVQPIPTLSKWVLLMLGLLLAWLARQQAWEVGGAGNYKRTES